MLRASTEYWRRFDYLGNLRDKSDGYKVPQWTRGHFFFFFFFCLFFFFFFFLSRGQAKELTKSVHAQIAGNINHFVVKVRGREAGEQGT